VTYRPQTADEPLWLPADEPARPPRTGQDGRFEPSPEDRSAAAEMSARGAFRPPPCYKPFNPRRGKWGRAIENWTAAGRPPVPEP
jgi:hypothetical protein